MSGYGVVLASRLENSCEPFKIHLSDETYKNLDKSFVQSNRFYPKLISIKHSKSLVKCYELSPFEDAPQKLSEANRFFNGIGDIKRVLDRYEPEIQPLTLDTVYGKMVVVNFGFDGYCLSSSTYLGHNVFVQIDLSSLSSAKTRIPRSMTVEVLWSAPKGGGLFFHGVKIVGLSIGEKTEILNRLKNARLCA
jgi:hypothetical protein